LCLVYSSLRQAIPRHAARRVGSPQQPAPHSALSGVHPPPVSRVTDIYSIYICNAHLPPILTSSLRAHTVAQSLFLSLQTLTAVSRHKCVCFYVEQHYIIFNYYPNTCDLQEKMGLFARFHSSRRIERPYNTAARAQPVRPRSSVRNIPVHHRQRPRPIRLVRCLRRGEALQHCARASVPAARRRVPCLLSGQPCQKQLQLQQQQQWWWWAERGGGELVSGRVGALLADHGE
jgi:hypothetical protein